MIEGQYKARATQGMTLAQVKEARRAINRKRLALQREEHAHALGFERDGMALQIRPELSIFVTLQFSVPGITALRGKGTDHPGGEPW
jgi:hypothetical protein